MQVDLENRTEPQGGHVRGWDGAGGVRVPLPFLDRDMGLGSAFSGLLGALGVKPCAPCKQRAAALDRRVRFVPWDE